MLVLRRYFKKSLRRYFVPSSKFMFKHYIGAILMTAMGCSIVLLMGVLTFMYLNRPGWFIYLYIALFFINFYTTFQSFRKLLAIRLSLKTIIDLTIIGKKLHDFGISMIVESIKQSKHEKNEVCKDHHDLQSDLENPS